jgi:hypothetical protein
MSFEEVIAVYSEKDTKTINTLCGQNAVLEIVKGGGTYNYHWVLKCLCPRSRMSMLIAFLNCWCGEVCVLPDKR